MTRRPAPTLVAAVLLITALAGCSPVSAGPTPTRSRPDASSTPAPATAPSPRVPVGCADLVSLATLRDRISPDVTVQRDENSDPVGWDAVVERQAGALDCAWGTADRTDSTFDDGLSFTVLVDAASAFDAFSRTADFPTGVATTVGDRSGIACDPASPICGGDVLVGSYWLDFTYSAKGHPGEVETDAVAALRGAAQRLAAAGAPSRAWTSPSGSFAAPECTAALGTALTGTTVQVVQPESETGTLWPQAVASARAGVRECTWETNPAGATSDVFTATVLAGGRWAFDTLARHGIGQDGRVPVSPTPLSGTDGVLSGCGQACEAVVSYRGSLVVLGASVGASAAGDQEKAAVDRMVSRLVASLGGGS